MRVHWIDRSYSQRTAAGCGVLLGLVLMLAAPLASAQTSPEPMAAPAAASSAEKGRIAWYGNRFAGHKTASGEVFNPNAMTMAHKTLAYGTQVKVSRPGTDKSVVLRVNDRVPSQSDRIGDVSQAAARKLGMQGSGVVDAEIEVLAMPKASKP